MPQCKAEGKPEPTIQLYDNNANCIQAILAGRADTYINDVNTVDNAVKAYPDKLEKAIAVTIPYSVGIAVPKNKPKFRDAVFGALTEIYKSGDQTRAAEEVEARSGQSQGAGSPDVIDNGTVPPLSQPCPICSRASRSPSR